MVHMTIRWWELHGDYTTDYTKEHRECFDAETPAECFKLYQAFIWQHDLSKYTMPTLIELR